MLYLVGGCSRSGKSLLAERMRARHGVPWFQLDALKMGLHLGAPSLGIHPDDDDLETADRMWPIIKGILEQMIWGGRDYLVEGDNLHPQTVAEFIRENDASVRACFLGYPSVAIETKAMHVAQHTGLPNDWLHQTGSDNVRRYLEVSRAKIVPRLAFPSSTRALIFMQALRLPSLRWSILPDVPAKSGDGRSFGPVASEPGGGEYGEGRHEHAGAGGP